MTEKIEIFHSKVITGFDKNGEIYQRIMPFEWQSLTDEEYKTIHSKNYNYEELARAIEALLRSKNHA